MSLLIVLLSLGLTLLAPSATLLVSPLALGMPHLAADAWCLFTRAPRRLAPAFLAWVGLPLGLMVLRRGGGWLPGWPGADLLLGGSALLAAALTAEAPWPERTAAAAAAALLGGVSVLDPRASQALLVHGHNFVAAGLWLWLARPLSRADRAAAGLFAAVLAAMALGALRPLGGTGPLAGFSPDAFAAAIAPGLGSEAARRCLWLFAFGQMVHYGAWLLLLPQALAGSRRLGDEWAALKREPWAAPAAALCLLVPAAGLLSPVKARAVFLSLAGCHAWLEIAALTQFVLHRPRAAPVAARAAFPARTRIPA